MKTIPMIFNQQMVQALVDGRKTVTSRPIKGNLKIDACGNFIVNGRNYGQDLNGNPKTKAFTHFHGPCRIGDLIWVRETFCIGRFDEVDAEHPDDRELIIEQCTGDCRFIPRQFAYQEGAHELDEVKWKPSIHMPRKASRLTLRVTGVRCEQLSKINKESAIKEGLITKEHRFPSTERPLGNVGYIASENSNRTYSCPVAAYIDLWNSIYSNWDENPWVWVIEFELIKSNVDKVINNEH